MQREISDMYRCIKDTKLDKTASFFLFKKLTLRKYQNWQGLKPILANQRLIVCNGQNICESVCIQIMMWCTYVHSCACACSIISAMSCFQIESTIQCRGCQYFDGGWTWWCSHTPHWEKEMSNTPKLPWRPPYGLPTSQTRRVRGGAASTYMFYCESICIRLSAMKSGSGRLTQLFECSVTLQRCELV